MYDTTNEVQNRLQSLGPAETPPTNLDPSIVQDLIRMLDEYNPLAQQFRVARDCLQEAGDEEFVIRIVGPRDGDPPQYSLPTVDQLAMLVVGDFSPEALKRDIVVQTRSGVLKQISALHPAFMALQYPLLFPFGERGFQVGVLYEGARPLASNAYTKITMQDYFCYMFHYRRS